MEMKKGWPCMDVAKRSELQQIINILQEIMPSDIVILYGQYVNGKMCSKRGGYELLLVTQSDPPMEGWMLETKLKKKYPCEKRLVKQVHIETACIHDVNGKDSSRWFYRNIRNEGFILFENKGEKFQNIFSKRGFKSTRAYNSTVKNYNYYFSAGSGFLMNAEQLWKESHRVPAVVQLSYAAKFLLWTIETVFYGNHISGSNLMKDFKRAAHFAKFGKLTLKGVEDRYFFNEIDMQYHDIKSNANFVLSTKRFNMYVSRLKTLQQIVQETCLMHLDYLALCKTGIKMDNEKRNVVSMGEQRISRMIRWISERVFGRKVKNTDSKT